MTRTRRLLILTALLIVAPLAAKAQDFTLFVTHGIPGPDGFPVDVEVSGVCALLPFRVTLAYAVGVPGESFTVISKSFVNR